MDRVGPHDLVHLVTEGAVATNMAAVLVLDGEPALEEARAALAQRIVGIPRLRQCVQPVPWPLGRPLWVDDAGFDLGEHVRQLRCPGAGSEDDLLQVAAAMATRRLPRDRPLWAAWLVSGLAGGRAAVVIVLHHVLADGIGGLAVLAGLVDGAMVVPETTFPQPPPTRRALLADALRCDLAGVRSARRGLVWFAQALAMWRHRATRSIARTSLNRPTGAGRRLSVVRVPLDAVHATAHANGATVNDVALAAVGGALHDLLAERGERLDSLITSVPAAGRMDADAQRLGNEVGVMPIEVPAGEPDAVRRLRLVAERTAQAKREGRGIPPGLLNWLSRVLGRLHLAQAVVDRQRLVNTFVTNVRGPADRLSLFGRTIVDIVPITQTMGNITVSFAVFSYAGTLTITVVADPATCPDDARLAALLQRHCQTLVASAAVRTPA